MRCAALLLEPLLKAPALLGCVPGTREQCSSTVLQAARTPCYQALVSAQGKVTQSAALAVLPSSSVPASSTQALPRRGHYSTLPASPTKNFVLYRGRGMQLFRLLVRFKVMQLTGIAAAAIPINTVLATGNVAATQLVLASALVGGSVIASSALNYYARRYVGELALLPGQQAGEPTRVRFSVLTFWGNREDKDVPLHAVVPPLQNLPKAARKAVLQEPLLPIDVEGERQFFISVRHGQVVDGKTLEALLAGQLEGQQMPVAHQT